MSTTIAIILVIISIVMRIFKEKSKADMKKQTPTPHPIDYEAVEEDLRNILRKRKEDEEYSDEEYSDEEYDDEEYYDEEETDDEEDAEEEYTPAYEHIPIPNYNNHRDQEHIDFTYGREDMCTKPMSEGLPEEGKSTLGNIKGNNTIKNVEDPVPQMTLDELRRAVVYKTILDRPNF